MPSSSTVPLFIPFLIFSTFQSNSTHTGNSRAIFDTLLFLKIPSGLFQTKYCHITANNFFQYLKSSYSGKLCGSHCWINKSGIRKPQIADMLPKSRYTMSPWNKIQPSNILTGKEGQFCFSKAFGWRCPTEIVALRGHPFSMCTIFGHFWHIPLTWYAICRHCYKILAFTMFSLG